MGNRTPDQLLKKLRKAIAKEAKWAQRVESLTQQLGFAEEPLITEDPPIASGSALAVPHPSGVHLDSCVPERLTRIRALTENQRGSVYLGVQSAVARQLGITRGVVSRVAKGSKTSARVTEALNAEFEKVESMIVEASA